MSSTVDLTRPTGELCAELGVTPSTISRLRRKAGLPLLHPGSRRTVDPATLSIDWEMSNVQLAKLHGVSSDTVRRWRHEMAKSTVPKRINWKAVRHRIDWNQRNDLIAKVVGCDVNLVVQARARFKVGPGARKPGSGLWKRKAKQ